MDHNKKYFLRFIFCALLLSTPQKTHCFLWLFGYIPHALCVAGTYMATESGRKNVQSTLMYIFGFLFYAKKDMEARNAHAETQDLQKENHEQKVHHNQELSKKNLDIALTTKNFELTSQILQKKISKNKKLGKKLRKTKIENIFLENALQKSEKIMVEIDTQIGFLVKNVGQVLEASPENETLLNQINNLQTNNTQPVSLNLQNNTNINTVIMNNEPNIFQEKDQSEYGPCLQAVKIRQTRNSFFFQNDPLSNILPQKVRTQHVRPDNDEFKLYAQKHVYPIETLRNILHDVVVLKKNHHMKMLQDILLNANNIQKNIKDGRGGLEAMLLHKTEQDLCSLTDQPEEQYRCQSNPAHQTVLLNQNKRILEHISKSEENSSEQNVTRNNSTVKQPAPQWTVGSTMNFLFARRSKHTRPSSKALTAQ